MVRSPFQIECHRSDLDVGVIAEIVDTTLTEVARLLGVDGAAMPPTRIVIVAEGVSTVVEREIRVVPRAAGPRYSSYDWFELLFAHELTHLLVRDAWGLPAVLWWEGIAVHLGDDRVRARLFGHAYHAWCRALDELGAILPFVPLLRASAYYRRRADFRVDLQAGSFCGFLLQSRGPRRVGSFLAASRPITEPGVQLIDEILVRHLGADLARLQSEWRHFLRDGVSCVPELVAQLQERQLGGEADRAEHCDRCFSPLSATR